MGTDGWNRFRTAHPGFGDSPVSLEGETPTDLSKRLAAEGYAELSVTAADLSNRDFSGYDLTAVYFSHCNLQSTRFENTRLDEAFFDGCSLVGAQFIGCHPLMTGLHDCQLETATFRDCSGLITSGCMRSLLSAHYTNCLLDVLLHGEDASEGFECTWWQIENGAVRQMDEPPIRGIMKEA